jgi:predicted dehydrogenase
MGKAWGRNLRDHGATTVAGWVDMRHGAAAAAAEELGIQPECVGTDLEHAIKALNPDFVVDVTSPEGHREVTITALGLGIPVIGEKPMATNLREAKEMVRASETAGKLYMVSQSRRYDGRLQAYRRLIEANLGALGILNSDFYIGAHFGGFRDEMDHVLLVDMAIHTFDAARYLSQADPVSVFAEEFNPKWSWYQGDASATCLFEMTDGLRYTYRGSWCAEGSPSSWEGDWRAVGEKGTALWDGFGDPKGQVVVEPGGFHSKVEDIGEASQSVRSGIEGSLDEFLNALETGSTPNGECHDNIKSFAMVCAAVESSRRKQRVQIAELLD